MAEAWGPRRVMSGSYSCGGATWEMIVSLKKPSNVELLWKAISNNSGVMRLWPWLWASLPACSRTFFVMYSMTAVRKTGALELRCLA